MEGACLGQVASRDGADREQGANTYMFMCLTRSRALSWLIFPMNRSKLSALVEPANMSCSSAIAIAQWIRGNETDRGLRSNSMCCVDHTNATSVNTCQRRPRLHGMQCMLAISCTQSSVWGSSLARFKWLLPPLYRSTLPSPFEMSRRPETSTRGERATGTLIALPTGTGRMK